MNEYLEKLVKEIDYFYEWCPMYGDHSKGHIISFREGVWNIPTSEMSTIVTANSDDVISFIEEADYDLAIIAHLFEAKLAVKALAAKKTIESIEKLITKETLDEHFRGWEETFAQIEAALNKICKTQQKNAMQVIDGGES